MRDHMKGVKEILLKKSKLRKGDHILDIASNDGTLLNFFNKNLRRVAIDPLVNKYKKFYKNNIESVKQVLIENLEEDFLYGYSENYISVKISGKRNEVNKIIPVKLIQIEEGEMIGERQT